MQNASAQTATNMVAVYDSIQQTNANLESLNKNIINQTHKQAKNQNSLADLIQMSIGFLLLTIGLLTIIKYLGQLVDEIAKTKTPAGNLVDTYSEFAEASDNNVSSDSISEHQYTTTDENKNDSANADSPVFDENNSI